MTIQTRSRHHFSRALLQELEDPFNTGEEEDNDRTSVAFIFWYEETPDEYSIVLYHHGHQVNVVTYNIYDRPLEVTHSPMVA